jgi:hypothetical protein
MMSERMSARETGCRSEENMREFNIRGGFQVEV